MLDVTDIDVGNIIRLLYYLPMERMNIKDYRAWYEDELNEKIKHLEEENKKLREENEYRKRIVDVVPEWEGHIAEETIQDLQARINELNEELEWYKKHYEHEIDKEVLKGFGCEIANED